MADIFGKLKKQINKSVTTVSVKSTGILEATKVKGFISSLHEQKESMIKELGEVRYKMYLEEGIEESIIEDKCKEIKGIEDRIQEKQIELERIYKEQKEILGNKEPENAIRCECGEVLQEGSNFCVQCGKKVG